MRTLAERAAARGFTLIELVITIVVVSAGVAGVLSVMNLVTARSADPILIAQAHAISQSHLEEILLRAYDNPDGVEAGESRPVFDDVDDYDGFAANGCSATSAACPVLGDCVCDQFGNPVDALAGYTVTVVVVGTLLNGIAAKRVDVSVGRPEIPALDVSLSGYRTSY